MHPSLEVFPKLPLGGVDRRALVQTLAAEGAKVAAADLAREREALSPTGAALPEGSCALLLGGSGGILRALAIQLLFAERMPVVAVHYDSEKMQIGVHHARAISAAAADAGVPCTFVNADATKPETIAQIVGSLAGKYRCVHLINGIASGATKRFAEHGPTRVRDLDVAFDPVRQTPDFSRWSSLRRLGLVDVEVATEVECERTYKLMGHSTAPWVDALHQAGLHRPGESLVAFADYDFEPDDPVYGKGPLARAKELQRDSMRDLSTRLGARAVRICYPAMCTTALGAIPGGLLMFAGRAQVMLERKQYKPIATLARETMQAFSPSFADGELRLDRAYKEAWPEFHRREVEMTNEDPRAYFPLVFENPSL